MEISKRVEKLIPSGIRAFFDLVLEAKDIISLGVGEPDFITPWNIREKAIYAIEKGYTSYTSNKGLPELREQISRFLKNRYALTYDSDQEILITVGVSEAQDLAARALLNSGERVVIPDPYYISYPAIVALAGGIPVYLPTDISSNFKINPAELDRICREKKIKVLMINYPANPTGSSYSKQELSEIASVVTRYDLTVISDEIYDQLTYDFDHLPFASLKGMKSRTIYLNGFSKSYAMTGWRVGFACGPRKIIAAMTKIHQYTMLCASTISQMAAIEALKNGLPEVNQMKKEYRRRREFIVAGLNRIGLKCHKPEGAFYVFPSIKNTGCNCVDFAHMLLKQEKVALIPGTAFGTSGRDYVRISYASSLDSLREAINRIEHFLESKPAHRPASPGGGQAGSRK